MALEYGINFNTKDGREKAETEIKKWRTDLQKYLDKSPLDLNLKTKDVGDGAKEASKNVKAISEQIKKLNKEFRELEFGKNLKKDGNEIINQYKELRAKAGVYAQSLDSATKSQDKMASKSYTDKIKALSDAWNKLTLTQRKGTEGQGIIVSFTKLTDSAGKYAGSLTQAARAQNTVVDSKTVKDKLNELAAKWDALSIAQRKGTEGKSVIASFKRITSAAGEYIGSIQNVISAEERLAKSKTTRGQLTGLEEQWESLSIDQRRGAQGRVILDNYNRITTAAGVHLGTIQDVLNEEKRVVEEVEKKKKIQQETTPAIDNQTSAMKRQSDVMVQLKSYAMNFLSVYAGIRMIKNLATITGEFEMQKISLQAILQDADKGAAIFERIKELAVISPFQFKDLVTYTKQLSAFSIPYEELYETTRNLADLSAGLGVGMDRLILAYGQVRSATVLRGQELRQFTEAGIPIIEELRKKLSEANGELVTTGEVFEYISARKVPFTMVRDIISEMTSEGGKFYMMQEKQSETLKGKISNLADAYQIMMANAGNSDGGLMKGTIDGIRSLIENYETVGKVLATLVITYGAYRGALLGATTAEMFMSGAYVTKIRLLRAAVVAQNALNAAMLVNPYVLLATAIIGLGAAFVLLRDRSTAAEAAQKKFNDTLAETQELADKERAKITELVNAVKDETKTRRERQLRLNELQLLYPDIFKKLDLETAKNIALAEAIRGVNEVLEDKADIQSQDRVVDITKELVKLRAEHGEFIFAGTESYQVNNLRKIKELEAERALIVKKTREEAEATTDALIDLADWQKSVNDFVKNNDAQSLAFSDEDGTVYSYIERIKGEYSDLTEKYKTYSGLVDEGSKKQAANYKKEIELAERLAKTMGFSLGADGKDPDIEQNAMIKAAERLAELRAKMSLEEKKYALEVRQANTDASDEGVKRELAQIQLNKEKELQSIEEREQAMINSNLDIARAKWESEGKKGVFSEDISLTKEQEDLIAALKLASAEKYAKEEDDLRKEIISKYRNYGLKKLAIEEQLSRDIADIETQRKEDGNEITQQRIDEATKIANKGISDLQKEVLSKYGLESFLSDGDMSDFIKDKIRAALPLFKSLSSATLSELQKIKDVLGDLEFSKELADDFEDAGGDLKDLIKLIKEAADSGNKAVDERITEKIIAGIDKLIGSLGKLASAFEGTSNSFLQSMGRFLGGISDGMSDITELVKLGDKATFSDQMSTGLSGLATIISTISIHVKANAEAQREWNDAMEESAQAMRIYRIEQEAYKDGIFGMGDPLAPAVAGVREYMAAMKELSDIKGQLGEGLVQVGLEKVPSDSAYAGFVLGGAGVGAAVGSIVPVIGTAIGAVVGGLVGGFIAGITSLFGSKATTKLVPVFKKLKDQYGYIYNEAFELNPQILLDYDELDDATKQIVDNWKEIKAKAEEAQEKIEETLKNIAGSIGEDLYSALIDAFDNEDLDAALEKFRFSVNKILSDLAKRMLFNAIFGDTLDKGEQRMKDSLGEGGDGDILDDIDWIGDELEKGVPVYIEGTAALEERFKDLGRTLTGEEDAATNLTGISKGISTISEDTALVLGGYLDSIRFKLFQYVDYMMLPENRPTMTLLMQGQTEAINHLQAIELNTKVTADTNTGLLDNINKMMVSTSDGWKLKVEA